MDRKMVEELKSNWSPEAELGRSRPREVRIAGAGIAVRAIGFLLIIAAPIVCLFWAPKLNSTESTRDAMARNGQAVNAEVVRVWETKDESKQTWVAYRFDAAGHNADGRSKAPRKIWTTLRVGSVIPVRFLPRNPKINHPAEWEESRFPIWIIGGLGAVLCALGGFLQYRVARQRGLLEEGRTAPGIITKYVQVERSRIAHYEFVLLNGSVVKGRCRAARNLPPVGGSVTVIYDAENPKRNSTYPMVFWKLANVSAAKGVRRK